MGIWWPETISNDALLDITNQELIERRIRRKNNDSLPKPTQQITIYKRDKDSH